MDYSHYGLTSEIAQQYRHDLEARFAYSGKNIPFSPPATVFDTSSIQASRLKNMQPQLNQIKTQLAWNVLLVENSMAESINRAEAFLKKIDERPVMIKIILAISAATFVIFVGGGVFVAKTVREMIKATGEASPSEINVFSGLATFVYSTVGLSLLGLMSIGFIEYSKDELNLKHTMIQLNRLINYRENLLRKNDLVHNPEALLQMLDNARTADERRRKTELEHEIGKAIAAYDLRHPVVNETYFFNPHDWGTDPRY